MGQPKFDELDFVDKEVRKSLSMYDWHKHWWMMYNLIVFNPAWLLDAKIMKAVLQAAADRIILVEID